jgi:hypothetical protein
VNGIDPVEVAHGLMLDKARSVSRLEVRNALGDFPEAGDLSDEEFDALVRQALDEIEAADIEIGGC